MSTLFDTETGAPVELAPPDVVRSLVDSYGYRADVVRKWTKEKAEAILASSRKKKFEDLNHARAKAAEQQESDSPHPPTGRELAGRIEAATCLEQARAAGDADDLLLALTHAMYPLTAQELDDTAGAVIQQLRLHPDTLELLVPPGGRS